MYLELVDVLRCPVPHEQSPLVAAITKRADRDVIEGVLGCAVCHAEYAIRDGVALFAGTAVSASDEPLHPYAEPIDELAVRCAAMLQLFDPGGVVVLGGRWGMAAAELTELTRTLAIVVDPPGEVRLGNGIAALRVGDVLPLAAGSIRGIALDERTSTPALVASAARSLKPGGRLIAVATASLPAGVVEQARDDRHWVAEVGAAASAPVQLIRTREPG